MKLYGILIAFFTLPLHAGELERAIQSASKVHGVPAHYLRAIAKVESSFRPCPPDRKNKNGTLDVGAFQINTVNWDKCTHLNLRHPEGSARCAARIIRKIKPQNLWDLAKYHSKTPRHREAYYKKLLEAIQ